MLRDLLNLVFPEECPACEKLLLDQEKGICISCLNDFELTDFEHNPITNDLFMRFAGLVKLEGAAALWFFDKKGKLQKVIEALKYHEQPHLGYYLGEYMGHSLKNTPFIQAVDVIVPVPLHTSRFRERGYNQSEEISRGLAKVLDLPMNTKSLIRHEKTITQTKKAKEERWKNVERVFSLKQPLQGNILLIDDVITTGSTIASCIQAVSDKDEIERIQVLAVGVTRME